MDLKQIGMFIAELRKKKNLTQAALGEKVGVTGKAVSKWENGQSLPDVSILNTLSDILGVTTTELLNGNYIDKNNQEDIDDVTENSIKFYKENLRKKLMRIIIALFIIIFVLALLILTIFVANNYNTCQIYSISSEDKQFKLSGMLIITNKKNVLIINNIKYLGTAISDIYALDYKIMSNNNYTYLKSGNVNKFGYDDNKKQVNINDLLNKISIYVEEKNDDIKLDKMLNGKVKIIFNYIGRNDNVYSFEIPLSINRDFSNTKLIY